MSRQRHYDERGYYIGETDEDGRHYDERGYYTGRTDDDGRRYDERGYYTGRTDDDGRHYDERGYYTGRTDEDGRHYDERGYYTGNSGESSGCYLTTACVEYRGLEDDCYELTTLRNFRDTYMKENMQCDIDEYYKIAPGIVDKINILDEESRKNHYEYIYEVITKCCKNIENNDNDAAYTEYKKMVNTLNVKCKIKV